MVIEMVERYPGEHMITETDIDFSDCLDLVRLRYCDMPGKEYMANASRDIIGRDGAGYVPLEICVNDLDDRVTELGYKVEGNFCRHPDSEGVIYRLVREDDGGKLVSSFSVYELQGSLWVTNSACRRFFQTVMGVEPHFYREGGAVG